MFKALTNRYSRSKSLVNYFALTYTDKIISFALPLSILFLIKDKELYTFVEVAFSYATLIMIVIELGVSNYLFFGYKNAEDKEQFLKQTLVNFKFLLTFYCLISIPLLIAIKYYDSKLLLLFGLVIIRSLFTLFLNFNANIFRLRDNPSGIYITSILVNVSSIILLMVAGFFAWPFQIASFFLPSLILIVTICLKFLFVEFSLFNFADFMQFLKSSLSFSWPVILNVLAMSFINNYAKIYAYGNLSEQEMVQVSYIMRIGMIIQLSHSAFASYFSKSLFMDKSQKLNFGVFNRYSLLLLFSAFLVLLAILASNYFPHTLVTIPFTLSTVFFLFYIVLWCYIGYLEIYFGVMNANRKILYYSIFSSVLYVLLLKISPQVRLFELSLFMVITAFINLLLVFRGLYTLGVLTFKKIS